MNTLVNKDDSFSKSEKDVVKILSFGTFLEYFDTFLFVHLSPLLATNFFSLEQKSNALILGAAYYSTNILRPIGALILGIIGDRIGRLYVLWMTIFITGICGLGMVFLPTYAQIGVVASWVMVALRSLQGVCSMGEIVNAKIYVQEYFKGRKKAAALCLISIGCFFGGQSSIYTIILTLEHNINFRLIFMVGFIVFLMGIKYRKQLYENRTFTKVLSKSTKKIKKDIPTNTKDIKLSTRLCISAIVASSMGQILWSLAFIIINPYIEKTFNFSNLDIAYHNSIANWPYFLTFLGFYYITKRVYPGWVSLVRHVTLIPLLLAIPFVIGSNPSYHMISFFQILLVLCASDPTFDCLLIQNTPILKRSTISLISFAAGKILGLFAFYLLTVSDLVSNIGFWAYPAVCIPIAIISLLGVINMISIDRANDKGFHKYYG